MKSFIQYIFEKRVRVRTKTKIPRRHIENFIRGQGKPIEIGGQEYGNRNKLVIPGHEDEPVHVATLTPRKPSRHIRVAHQIDLHACPSGNCPGSQHTEAHKPHVDTAHSFLNSRAMEMQASGKLPHISQSGTILKKRSGQTGMAWGVQLGGSARFVRRTGEPPPQHPIQPNKPRQT